MGHITGRGEEEKAPSELTSLGLSPLPDTCAHVHGLINELSLYLLTGELFILINH